MRERRADVAVNESHQRHWRSGIALIACIVFEFLVVGAIGARQAAADTRVLGCLDPLFELVRTSGWQMILWLVAHSILTGWTATGLAVAMALSALSTHGRGGAPLVLLVAAVCLGVWGQICLLNDFVPLGTWLYGGSVVCAVTLGALRPLHRLPGFPRLPPAGNSKSADTPQAPTWLRWEWECLLIFLLTSAALLLRTYALTELPQGVDLETIDLAISSRTLHGLATYIPYGLVANAAGIMHLLIQPVLFKLFGTSIYSLRLSAALWGVAAVPLFYWLVRRAAGAGAAIAGTVLFIVAPEQLFWSRTENTFFPPIAVVALVTVHLGLWMVHRFSPWAVVGAALWMPVCRFFYAPAMVMVVYPLALCTHAFIFARSALRKAWYVVPILAGGLALWVFSLSLVYWYVNDWNWRFVHPASVHGAPVWRMHGEGPFREARVPELLRLQASVVLSNLGEVVSGFADHGPRMFSHFFQRGLALPNHMTALNAGVMVLLALGFGYLLGQCYERRAFVFLAWAIIGLLPAVMSDEPSARRLSLVFPAVYAIAGVMLAASVGIVRAHGGRVLAAASTVLLSVVVAAVAWASLASHLMVGMAPIFFRAHIRFAQPLFERSDLILHNLSPGIAKAILFGNLDKFLESHPCLHQVDDRDWLSSVLLAPCDFGGYPYTLTTPPEQVETLRQAYRPKRISYLLQDDGYAGPHIELLRQLFPLTELRTDRSVVDQRTFVSMTVDAADVDVLRSPAMLIGSRQTEAKALDLKLLDGVRLQAETLTDADSAVGPGIVVRGGLLVDHDGWYGFQLRPYCPSAMLTVDHRSAPFSEPEPMLAGAHVFEIAIPGASACQLPLQILQSQKDGAFAPVDPMRFVSPFVTSVPQAQAASVNPYPGYGHAAIVAEFSGGGIDLGVDGQGRISVLILEEGVWRVQRFDTDGHEDVRWRPDTPPGEFLRAMVVEPDGTYLLLAGSTVFSYDDAGNQTGAWTTPWAAASTDMAVTQNGWILLAVPSRNSIAVFSHDGKEKGELRQFDGGPGRFTQPASVSVNPTGHLLVIQDDGSALLFRITEDALDPRFAGAFRVDFKSLPTYAQGSAIDGSDRILVPDPSTPTPLVYKLDGQRMMAASAPRDLSTKGLAEVRRFLVTADKLYALERSGQRVLTIER
jgi:hypothetical protein